MTDFFAGNSHVLGWGAVGGLLRPVTMKMRAGDRGVNSGVTLAWGWAALEGAFTAWLYDWWAGGAGTSSVGLSILFGWLGAYLFGILNILPGDSTVA